MCGVQGRCGSHNHLALQTSCRGTEVYLKGEVEVVENTKNKKIKVTNHLMYILQKRTLRHLKQNVGGVKVHLKQTDNREDR